MITRAALTLALLVSMHAQASPEDLSKMMRARSQSEIDAIARQQLHESAAKEECAAQIATKTIPRACFAAGSQSAISDQSVLIRRCVEIARASRSRRDLESDTSNIELPKTCASAIEERLADLDYLQADHQLEK